MAEETEMTPDVADDADAPVTDELGLLKQRARLMGIKISNNIGLDALKAKIAAAQAAESKEELEAARAEDLAPLPSAPPEIQAAAIPAKETHQQIRERLLADATKLIRLRITNLDPKKKDLPGEIFTVANEYIGTIRKYIPFGEVTENGYHVPNVIYEQMKARKFLHVKVTKVGGREHVETSDVPEFSLEVLPQLTQAELNKLALEQAARAHV